MGRKKHKNLAPRVICFDGQPVTEAVCGHSRSMGLTSTARGGKSEPGGDSSDCMLGKWHYGTSAFESFMLSRNESGKLCFSRQSAAGKTSGIEKSQGQQDGWLVFKLVTGCSCVGTLRLCFDHQTSTIKSNFKSNHEHEWGETLVACQDLSQKKEMEKERRLQVQIGVEEDRRAAELEEEQRRIAPMPEQLKQAERKNDELTAELNAEKALCLMVHQNNQLVVQSLEVEKKRRLALETKQLELMTNLEMQQRLTVELKDELVNRLQQSEKRHEMQSSKKAKEELKRDRAVKEELKRTVESQAAQHAAERRVLQAMKQKLAQENQEAAASLSRLQNQLQDDAESFQHQIYQLAMEKDMLATQMADRQKKEQEHLRLAKEGPQRFQMCQTYKDAVVAFNQLGIAPPPHRKTI
ncbi:unnamed protein product [Polarella glacialis]|uniref:Uncharacterized protein n=1 Tax=Polarella glacialis TaxID=89957 RepID=A0A813FN46_POLGL|nr:unnamed protein product [Polarella glacialis]